MNILHVIADLNRRQGGPETAVIGLAQAQAALDHHVSIMATDEGLESGFSLEGVTLRLFVCQWKSGHWSGALSRALGETVKECDIVHIHGMWDHSSWSAALACRRARTPYVLTPHGMLEHWPLAQNAWKKKLFLAFLGRRMLSASSAVHLTSELERQKSHLFDSKSKAFVIPLGVSAPPAEKLPAPDDFRRRFPSLTGRRILLFLGRLHFKKKPEVAMRAFAAVRAEFPDLTLVMAGSASAAELAGLTRLAHESGLESSVLFTGMLDRAAVWEAFRSAELFVLPSQQENFGLSVLEAMAAGCPVLVSPAVGVAGVVEKSAAGRVVSADPQSLAAALRELLPDGAERAAMGQRGMRYARAHCLWSQTAQQMTQKYDEILSHA